VFELSKRSCIYGTSSSSLSSPPNQSIGRPIMTEHPRPPSSPRPPQNLVFLPPQSHKDSSPSPSSSQQAAAVSSSQFQSTSLPTSTPLPPSGSTSQHQQHNSNTTSKPHPLPPFNFPNPTLRLEIRDLNHAGAQAFLSSTNASTALQKAVQSVLTTLYHSSSNPLTHIPPTRSVTLILRSMPGVAYTTSMDLDVDHKEIHFSLDYIKQITPSRLNHEILGVLTHEMVHCYQYNAHGTCPGGLIEGIADYVRLKANLSPPHWSRSAEGEWDAGYQTTGYFLEYLEGRFGEGLVRRINEALRKERYDEKKFWAGICGGTVKALWKDYGIWLGKGGKSDKEE
jgi:hypothetical protein